MSNIYIQEPPALGKVLLKTSAGDIDIELWTKEAPKACRNFIQLCMEGYYKGTIFHRVVPGFIVQGGDPNGDGTGGESVFGGTFKDEFHQRLRFNRRGLVAMANAGKDDNGSQFFFTLAATPELQNKHTIFGKVTGDTIYNVLKLAEGLIGPDDRPEHPHKITGADVVINPYEDIVPRVRAVKESKGDERKVKRERKAVKNFGLLSFGEEAEEDEGEAAEFRGKPKSTHDLLDDPKLSKLTAADLEEQEKQIAEKGPTQEEIDTKLLQTAAAVGSIRDKLKSKRDKSPPTSGKRRKETEDKSRPSDTRGIEKVDQRSSEKRGREMEDKSGPSDTRGIEKVDQRSSEKRGTETEDLGGARDKDSDSGGGEYYLGKERDEEMKKERERIKSEFQKLKKEMKGSKDKGNKPEETIDSVSNIDKQNDNEMYTEFVEEQEKYKKLKEKIPKKGAAREDFTLQLLAKFKNKLSAIKEKTQAGSDTPATATAEAVPEAADDDVNNDEWLGHTLRFEDKQPVLAKDASSKSDDWFDIYDPRNPINKRKRERSEKTKQK